MVRILSSLALATLMLGQAPATFAADRATIDDEQIKKLEIRVEAVKPAETEAVAVLSGTVTRPLNSRRTMTAPFSGTVTQILVLPGQRVEKGLPLATVSSRELLDSQGQLAQAQAELQAAEAVAHRRRALADKDIQSPKLADEAEAQVQRIKAVIEHRRQTLNIDGISLGPNGDYTISAPLGGTVVDARAMPGDGVEANAAIVTIDTSDELWVEVQVPAQMVQSIEVGDAVRVSTDLPGRVVSLGASIDATTRSVKMYASIANTGRVLPGQMLNVMLERASAPGSLSVPAASVTRINGNTCVFIKVDGGFELKPVELRGRSLDRATIVGAINPDDLVAASGIPQLEQLMTSE